MRPNSPSASDRTALLSASPGWSDRRRRSSSPETTTPPRWPLSAIDVRRPHSRRPRHAARR
jgi:hypothetical protein